MTVRALEGKGERGRKKRQRGSPDGRGDGRGRPGHGDPLQPRRRVGKWGKRGENVGEAASLVGGGLK